MLDRINEVKKVYRITNKDIADNAGKSIDTINKQMLGLYKINIETISAILRLAPEVDARWLLLGENSNSIELRLKNLEDKVSNIERNYVTNM